MKFTKTYSAKQTPKSVVVLRNGVAVTVFDRKRNCWFIDDGYLKKHRTIQKNIRRYAAKSAEEFDVRFLNKNGCWSPDIHDGIFRSLGGGKSWN